MIHAYTTKMIRLATDHDRQINSSRIALLQLPRASEQVWLLDRPEDVLFELNFAPIED